jgi:tRNA-modifying protein YgfZ
LSCIDCYVPVDAAEGALARIRGNFKKTPAVTATMEAFETARIENGVPRFGVDMDENTLVPEAIERAISYNKGCYIGQEVIARIRTYGQVAKALRWLRFNTSAPIAKAGDKILYDGKEVGWVTSVAFSPRHQRLVALGYVRKECNQIGTTLLVNGEQAEIAQP